jgi:hypothetical protein
VVVAVVLVPARLPELKTSGKTALDGALDAFEDDDLDPTPDARIAQRVARPRPPTRSGGESA